MDLNHEKSCHTLPLYVFHFPPLLKPTDMCSRKIHFPQLQSTVRWVVSRKSDKIKKKYLGEIYTIVTTYNYKINKHKNIFFFYYVFRAIEE